MTAAKDTTKRRGRPPGSKNKPEDRGIRLNDAITEAQPVGSSPHCVNVLLFIWSRPNELRRPAPSRRSLCRRSGGRCFFDGGGVQIPCSALYTSSCRGWRPGDPLFKRRVSLQFAKPISASVSRVATPICRVWRGWSFCNGCEARWHFCICRYSCSAASFAPMI
jgi:hypothetical protein